MTVTVYLMKNFYIFNPREQEFDFYRGSLLIQAGKIEKIFRQENNHYEFELDRATAAAGTSEPVEIIDGKFRQLIFPGFIQSHIHLCQTMHRGLAENLTLLDWLKDEVWPYEAGLGRKQMGRAVLMGLKEILAGGTTAVLDMGTVREQDVIFEIMGKAGFRYTGGKAMMDSCADLPAALQETMDESISDSLRLYESFHCSADGLLHYAFCPRFLLSCSSELLRQVKLLSDDLDVIVHTHGAENPAEMEWIRRHYGKGNLAVLDSNHALNNNTVIAHAVYLDKSEIEMVTDYGLALVHCPSANLKLGSGVAPVAEYLAKDIHVGLGTDGAPCNNSLSILPELKLASLLQKGRTLNPALMTAEDTLRMVSLRGAEIIKLGDMVGAVAEGLEADLVLLDMDTPQTYNFEHNPAAAIVYGADSRNVKGTMVRGKFLYRDGQFSDTIESLTGCFNAGLQVLES